MALKSLVMAALLFSSFSMVLGDEGQKESRVYPLVVSTWPFLEAVRAAWSATENGFAAVDAVVEGCSACEELRCDGTDKALPSFLSRGKSHDFWVFQNRVRSESILIISRSELGPVEVQMRMGNTIDALVMDGIGHIAVGTSTNGATFKIPGRVGDGPIVGSSSYADTEVGACGATGDGDIMMCFLTCYQVVESMRLGMEPMVAAKDAISRIARKYPDFVGAVFSVDKNGIHAGACHGWTFQYSVRSPDMDDVQVFTVYP
ncbi:hypothetical protein GIB67_039611 [Kingdonia uniflora]|uniref:beta-aspartyl-peptidase n=1 Tax=Kingdonia uniflora TaxID=39325 RepID=A0A7J7P2R3_9MAGN|nr:hypothetical protein GIB67_039611 [Kingdonia uniflora]